MASATITVADDDTTNRVDVRVTFHPQGLDQSSYAHHSAAAALKAIAEMGDVQKPKRSAPRVYLSGPMTGLPDLNFPAFRAAAEHLRGLGLDVVNPADINPDESMGWEACMRADIKALCDCDAIALLPGWEYSKGAHLELHIASRLGLKVTRTDKDDALILREVGQQGDTAPEPEGVAS